MPQKDILVGWEGAERSFVQVKTTTWFMIGMEPSLPKTQWSVITFYNLEKVLTDIILSFITITKKMEFRKPQTGEEWDQFLSRKFKVIEYRWNKLTFNDEIIWTSFFFFLFGVWFWFFSYLRLNATIGTRERKKIAYFSVIDYWIFSMIFILNIYKNKHFVSSFGL